MGIFALLWKGAVIGQTKMVNQYVKTMQKIEYADRTSNQKNLTWCLGLYII